MREIIKPIVIMIFAIALIILAWPVWQLANAQVAQKSLQLEQGVEPTAGFRRILSELAISGKSPLEALIKGLDGLTVAIRVRDCNGSPQYTAAGKLKESVAREHGVTPTLAWIHSSTVAGLISQIRVLFEPSGLVQKEYDMREAGLCPRI